MSLLQWYAVVSMEFTHLTGLPLPIDPAYDAFIAQTYLDGDKTCGEVAETLLLSELLITFMG